MPRRKKAETKSPEAPQSHRKGYRLRDPDEPYNILFPWKTLDPWQVEYIEAEGNCALLTGRQCGKSTAMSIKMAELAVNKHLPGEHILCFALTERQAFNIFTKCLNYLEYEYPEFIKRGKDKPTKHEINLTTGVTIMCHPTGLTGEGLRTYTIKKLMGDEASRIEEAVFISLLPMLSVIDGTIDLGSTPCGKDGFFWKAFNPDDPMSKEYKHWKVSAEDCPRHKKEFLESQKNSMSALRYAEEYLGEFLDELKRFFSDELIDKCCVLDRPETKPSRANKYFLGVDIARMGEDESTFEILQHIDGKEFHQVENIITTKTFTTQTQQRIIDLENAYSFYWKESIGIDAGAGSLGVGVYDNIMNSQQISKRKLVALNNRAIALDSDGKKKQRILKEDLYDNLRGMMERGEIKLLKDKSVKESLRSVRVEHLVEKGRSSTMVIFGDYTHVVEGIHRAAWLASKAKLLNFGIDYI